MHSIYAGLISVQGRCSRLCPIKCSSAHKDRKDNYILSIIRPKKTLTVGIEVLTAVVMNVAIFWQQSVRKVTIQRNVSLPSPG
jgi:hypothetical protein